MVCRNLHESLVVFVNFEDVQIIFGFDELLNSAVVGRDCNYAGQVLEARLAVHPHLLEYFQKINIKYGSLACHTWTFHQMLPLLWTKIAFLWRIIFICWQKFRFLTFPKPPWAWPILKTQGNLSWARICNFTPFGTWRQNRNMKFCRSFFSMNEAYCEGFAEANALLLKLILQIGNLHSLANEIIESGILISIAWANIII